MMVSIIIPLYNSAKFIKRSIASCFESGLYVNDFEIVVVDDGSTDDSYSITQQYVVEIGRRNIKLFKQPNRGAAAARNKGLQEAQGKYILFLDADDYYLQGSLSYVLEVCEKNELDVCAFQGRIMKSNGAYDIGFKQHFCKDKIYTGNDAIMGWVNIASACVNMYSSNFIRKYNLQFPEGMTREDVVFNTRMYPLAQRIMFTDIIAYVYTWNNQSIDRSMDSNRIMENIKNDLKVAAHTKDIAESCIPNVKQRLCQRSNSIVWGVLIALLQNRLLTFKQKKECLIRAEILNLYPIQGETLAKRNNRYIHLLNIKSLYICALLCSKYRHKIL